MSGLLAIGLHCYAEVACARRPPDALCAHREIGAGARAALRQHSRGPSGVEVTGRSSATRSGEKSTAEVVSPIARPLDDVFAAERPMRLRPTPLPKAPIRTIFWPCSTGRNLKPCFPFSPDEGIHRFGGDEHHGRGLSAPHHIECDRMREESLPTKSRRLDSEPAGMSGPE